MNVDIAITKKIRNFKNRYIFSRYKFHLRKLVAPFFVSFSIVDYCYSPENIAKWFSYRLLFFIFVWLTFIPFVKSRKCRNYIQAYVSLITILACNIVNVMVYQSGGYFSRYYVGVILCAVAGIQLFKLNKIYSFIVQGLAYAPLIAILILTAPSDQLRLGIIQSLFFVGMAILSYIFGSSDEDNLSMLIKMKQKMKVEIERLNKTEMLKKFFPSVVRKEIESNPDIIGKKKKVCDVVVGFADISNSTQIANSIELEMDWVLKEKFLEAATAQALKNDLVVLTHLGDGFLFLANYVNKEVWQENLVTFFRSLIRDYQKIYASTVGVSGSIKSGIKFGLAKGDVMIGFLGSDQAYFTAIGPTVNLASRFCSKANSNELVVTEELWDDLSAFTGSLSFEHIGNNELKGFDKKWELVRISSLNKSNLIFQNKCTTCNATLVLEENQDGLLDYICTSCHPVLNHRAS
ncbi:MAG: adenylate/guanylate cyclase domain-containing protein [Pseudobdellovibrio sp.]